VSEIKSEKIVIDIEKCEQNITKIVFLSSHKRNTT